MFHFDYCFNYFLELAVYEQKTKQKEIIKRKLNTYKYIFSREAIAEKEPFIVKREYRNIPNSSQKKLENDVNDLKKTKKIFIKTKPYIDPSTNRVIPRANFLIPVKPLDKKEIFKRLKDNYLNLFS
jgi:hypothetical protein